MRCLGGSLRHRRDVYWHEPRLSGRPVCVSHHDLPRLGGCLRRSRNLHRDSTACPADGFASVTTVCRPSAGPCDAVETCTGRSANCPADSFQSTATVCRASTGPCDTAETCTGSRADCPADSLRSAGTVCRAAAGPCRSPPRRTDPLTPGDLHGRQCELSGGQLPVGGHGLPGGSG